MRRAISKKEKYERKTKDIDVGENLPENQDAEKIENIDMAVDAPIDYEAQIKDFDKELAEQPEIELEWGFNFWKTYIEVQSQSITKN